MQARSFDELLRLLEEHKRRIGIGGDDPESMLDSIARLKAPNADSLIRLHEVLLFLRAYPETKGILKKTETQLDRKSTRLNSSH